MKILSAMLGIFVAGTLIAGCDNEKPTGDMKVAETAKPAPGQKVGKVLPFQICDLDKNTAFNDGLSMVRADIKVDVGGHSNDWVATGLAVAKQLGLLGDSSDVQVYVYRSDLGELDNKQTPNGYKWLSRIDYAVTPQHALGTSGGGKQWLLTYATDDSVVTPQQIMIARDYQSLNEKFGNSAIDDKIVAMIKKKYNLHVEFHLPIGNLGPHEENPDKFFIDNNGQEQKLNSLGEMLATGGRNLECTT